VFADLDLTLLNKNGNNYDVTLYLKTEADPVPETWYYSNYITFNVLQDRNIPYS